MKAVSLNTPKSITMSSDSSTECDINTDCSTSSYSHYGANEVPKPSVTIIKDALLGDCIDLLENKERHLDLGSFGKVSIVDCMPRLAPVGYTAEYAVARSARVSYGNGLKTPKADNALCKYLQRNRHTSPSEFVDFVFRLEVPIAVSRQILRHRTASVNEFSMRYAEPEERFYVPESFRLQDSVNKQSSHGEFQDAALKEQMNTAYKTSIQVYNNLIEKGVAREIARMVLPVGIFTMFYFKMDMHNLQHFLRLRADPHTQLETRRVAEAMLKLARQVAPVAFDQFESQSKGVFFFENELDAIKQVVKSNGTLDQDTVSEQFQTDSVSERREFKAKLKSLLE